MRTRSLLVSALALIFAATVSAAQDAPPTPQTPEEVRALRRSIAELEAAEIADPEDIQTLRALELDAEAARASPGYLNTGQFRLITRNERLVSDGQGQPHHAIDVTLAKGIVTSIAFYDDNGQPWPVQSVAFDRERVAVNNDGCAGTGAPLDSMGNILVVTPCAFWASTNIQVLLVGETRPIPFTLTSGTREASIIVDGSLTVSVQSEAPKPYGRDRLGQLDTSWVRPGSRTLTIDPIDYATGGTYPVYVAPGITTDIAFMDSNRAPWPIAEIAFAPGIVAVNGPCDAESGGVRTIEFPDDSETTTMYLTPCQNATATVSVRMAGRAGAMSLVITPARLGETQPDGTFSIVVPGSSPRIQPLTSATASGPGSPTYRSGGFTHDRFLDEFLYGTPPQGATRAIVTGASGIEGWVFDGALYLRGPLNVVNPAYDASAQSPEGTLRVFKYGPPVSRILANDSMGREFVLNVTF